MESAGLPLSMFQLSDTPTTLAYESQGSIQIPFPLPSNLPFTFGEGLKGNWGLTDLTSTDLSILQDTPPSNVTVNVVGKMSDNFSASSDTGKSDSGRDLGLGSSLGEDKGMSPLNILVIPPYSDSPQTSKEALLYQNSGNAGDAMLSAINYNDNDILPESAFDMNTASGAGNLPQLDDSFLSNIGNTSQNIRLQEGQGSNTFDLFDSNVNDTLSLLPQPFGDTGLSVGENSNLSTTSGTTESDGQGKHAFTLMGWGYPK